MIGSRNAFSPLRGEKGETTMRRIVGISARSAVAVALPLAGALYVAAEARQAVIRRYSEVLNAAISTRVNSRSGDLRLAATGRVIEPGALESLKTSPAQDAKLTTQVDEVAAERQAAQIPAQKPPKSAKDSHSRQIIISIPDRRLALLEDGQLVKVYAVAVGKTETPSPDGEFTIINHAVNPVYRHEGKQVAPGKDNPLGTRWMGLSAKGYGIHGTNVQSSVGKVASHGCFRMKKKDVEALYARVQVGDVVSIHGERDELTASLFNGGNQNANPAVVAGKVETQIAAATTVSAAAGEDQ
jgi:lipoprotein-anchoring transpeptidase ErfK/SrfK